MKKSEWMRHQAIVQRMNDKRLAKLEKNTPISPKELEFSKDVDKDYFVELCAAEEVIVALRKDIQQLEEQLYSNAITPVTRKTKSNKKDGQFTYEWGAPIIRRGY